MKKENKLLYVKKSRNGKGIFLKKAVSAGDILFRFTGKLITCEEDEEVDEKTRSNTIRFNNDKFLSPKGKIGDYINHSCNPNTKIIKRNNKLLIIAIKNILKSREVSFDYSTVLANDDMWIMKCNCGSKNCRKIIKKFSSLPKKIRDRYISGEIVPAYILKIKNR